MNWNLIIDIALRVGIVVMAFAWGYERGYGKALEEEIKYNEKLLKEREAANERTEDNSEE